MAAPTGRRVRSARAQATAVGPRAAVRRVAGTAHSDRSAHAAYFLTAQAWAQGQKARLHHPSSTRPASAPAERNLLRDAVNVAAAEQDLARRYAAYAPPGEQPPESRSRALVGARIEQRHDDAAVGDIEVDVARGETLAGEAWLA